MAKHILVVDDDPDIRQILQDRLESYGYLVEPASDGFAALEKLKRLTPSGVILDIRMPGMGGVEVLRRIRLYHPSLPVIVGTAAGNGQYVSPAFNAGAQAYLLKPFDTLQIKQVVERWFGNPLGSECDR